MIGAFSLRYEAACRAVVVVFVVNAAMILYTLRGAVVAGFFPALAAAHSTYRTWLLDVDRSWSAIRTFRTFGEAWRAEFPRANAPGYAIAALWAVLVVDHQLLQRMRVDALGSAVSGVLVVVIVVFALFSILFWVVRATFDEPARWIVRTSAQMVIARPLCSLMLLGVAVVMLWLAMSYPAAALTIGPSAVVFVACAVVFAFGRLPGMSVADRATAS